jgi:hypothetical protein
MIFKCLNEKEIISKGLPLLGELDLSIDRSLIETVRADPGLILMSYYGSYTAYRLPKSTSLPAELIHLWIIIDESYTDNLDGDTFTYFKYASSETSS